MSGLPVPGNLALLQSLADERVLGLVRNRLLYGMRFFDKNTLRKDVTRADAKLALLMCLCANPNESLTGPELNLIAGRQQKVCAQERENSAPEQENSAPSKKTKKRC